MKYLLSPKIHLLYATSSDTGGSEKAPKKEIIEKKEEKKWYEGALDRTGNLGKAASKLASAFASDDPKMMNAISLLQTTGTLPTGKISDLRIIKTIGFKFDESGAISVIQAIEMAEKGVLPLIIYSNGNYRAVSKDVYENEVCLNPELMNQGVAPGLLQLAKRNSPLGFRKETWSNISIYCASRGWKTAILEDPLTKTQYPGGEVLKTLYSDRKAIEEKKLESSLAGIIPEISKYNKELAELLGKRKLKLLPSGAIDAEVLIKESQITNAKEIPKLFADLASSLKQDAQNLLQKSKEIAKKTKTKNLKELGVVVGNIDIAKDFTTYTLEETRKAIIELENSYHLLKSINPNDPKNQEYSAIIILLQVRRESFEGFKRSADTNKKSQLAKKQNEDSQKKGVILTPEDVGKNLNSERNQTIALTSQDVSLARIETEESRDYLRQFQIYAIATAQKELKRLSELGRPLTSEEESQKAGIIAFIDSKKREAQVYSVSKKILGEKEAQEIFTEANRFITGNHQETYDFKIIEKTAIMTDLESTAGEKNLARMKPGDTVSMTQIVEGEMHTSIMNAPELTSIGIFLNEDGSYNIPTFGAKNISKEQLEEYKLNTLMYAELGLSQFIPLISKITTELQKAGYPTSIDGTTSTMEQQIVLKHLYSLLFGKTITSTNLSEVKHAFSIALGSPTNMKAAIQHTLKIHHLISESSQPIKKEVLVEWIRGNNTKNIHQQILEGAY